MRPGLRSSGGQPRIQSVKVELGKDLGAEGRQQQGQQGAARRVHHRQRGSDGDRNCVSDSRSVSRRRPRSREDAEHRAVTAAQRRRISRSSSRSRTRRRASSRLKVRTRSPRTVPASRRRRISRSSSRSPRTVSAGRRRRISRSSSRSRARSRLRVRSRSPRPNARRSSRRTSRRSPGPNPRRGSRRESRSRSGVRGSGRRTSRRSPVPSPRRRFRRESRSRSRVRGQARLRARQSTSPTTLKKRVQDLTLKVKRLEKKQKENFEFKNPELARQVEAAKESAVIAQHLVEGQNKEVELFSKAAIDVDFISNENDAERLDSLEGIAWAEYEFAEELEGAPAEEVEEGVKVVDSLRDKVKIWSQYGAGKMVQQVISSGLRLNFNKKLPTFYKESNNKSYKENEQFGIAEIRKLIHNDVIEEVEAKEVACINPLTVASNKKGKKRLCIDLSRHVNLHCAAKKFKVESVGEFIRAVKQGSWCWYYDLKSAFHHISVIEKHRKYLGFEVTMDGQAKVFRFKAMPFGYKDASRVLTKVMRTPICSWRKAGIPSFIHIDDGLGFKASEEEAVEAALKVKKDLENLGLVTSVEKCQWQPVQKFEWCGFFWDLVEFRVRITEVKKERIKSMAAKLLGQSLVSARELAALSGLIISCAPATGRNARFYTRFSVGWCQALVDLHSWEAKDVLSEEVREELKFWKERLDEFDSQLIRHSAGVFEYYVCSDSGEFFIGGTVTYKGKEQIQKRFQISLEKWERKCSSTYRELRSIECGLRLIGPEVRGQVVRYGNDNYAACKVVEFGSTKKDCHMVACRVAALVEEFDMKLEMVWRRRNTQEISLCDRLSKDFDLSEYRISSESFEEIEEEYGPWQIDWFASDWSRRMDRFASRYWTIGTEIIDAFSQDWGLQVGFFHPPLSEMARVMEKIESDRARGVVIVPDWPGSEVDSIMMQAKEMVELLDIRQMVFESPEWREDNTFRGLSGFGIRIYKTIF